MSEVKRYKPVINNKPCRPYAYCEENSEGIYVRIDDYDAIKAERDALAYLTEKPVDVESERTDFEAYMEENFTHTVDRRRCKNGDMEYMAFDMGIAWLVWKRRAKAPPVPVMKQVKLPKVKHPAQFDYADEVVSSLREAGIQIEGEE